VGDLLQARVAEWFRSVDLSPTPDEHAARLSAIGEVRQAVLRNPLGAVLVAHGHQAADAQSEILAIVRVSRPAFSDEANRCELQLMAAAAIADALDESEPSAETLAQCVSSAAFSQLPALIPELPELAVRALTTLSERSRSRATVEIARTPEALFSPPSKEEVPDPEEFTAALSSAVVEAFSSLSKHLDSVVSGLRSRLDAAEEEADLAWWAFAGGSTETRAFVTARGRKAVASPIAVALEFWRALAFGPEPPSTETLLSRVLGPISKRSFSLTEIIPAAASLDLRPAEVPEQGHPLLPILSAFCEFEAFAGKPAWLDGAARWAGDMGRAHESPALAHQLVREISIVLLTTG